MSDIKLGTVLKAQSAFGTIKRKLVEAGVDVSDIRYITDLPTALASIVPEDLAEMAGELLANEDALNALLTAFSAAAESGGLAHIFQDINGGILELKEDLK